MFSKLSKKGRNLAEVDNWLESLGYYRKNVAYDETCLFRAVSEQIFDCQVYHERVRKECVTFAKENYELFSQLVTYEMFNVRLTQLEKHMAICGILELHIISRKYKYDILIFNGKKQVFENVTKYEYPKFIYLCLMEDDHFDAIYRKEQIVTAGFCQSIVYTIFYEGVFNIQNVDEIVRNMLYEKHNLMTLSENVKVEPFSDDHENNNNAPDHSSSSLIAPFPFKVAKALDPNIYRNIEYDSWGETRRELRLGEWYYGDDKLIQGTRCIFTDPRNNEKYDCYIQKILEEQNKCVVYLTQEAVKKTVSYSDLAPEDDAKPWALPWRFTKSVTISNSSLMTPVEKNNHKNRRRTKERKKAKSENNLCISLPNMSESIENIEAYIGAPLQMQNSSENTFQTPTINVETKADAVSAQEPDSPDDAYLSFSRCLWQQPQWPTYLPPTPESYSWSPTSPSVMSFNYGLKPMVASAPVTPDVIPYHDPRYSIYYSYQTSDIHQIYSQCSANFDTPLQYVKPEEKPSEHFETDTPSVTDKNTVIKTEVGCEDNSSSNSLSKGKAQFTITIPAPIDTYSPIIPLHPGTPVIYTPTLPEVPEVMIQSSPVMYTPQFDMQYIQPGPCAYLYPPTPPPGWCPPAVNAQGFIFPHSSPN